MKSSKTKFVCILFALIFCYCSSDWETNPTNNEVKVFLIQASPLTMLINAVSTLSAILIDSNSTEFGYTWSSPSGQLSSTSGSSVQWTAPETPGAYEVTVTVTNGEITEAIRIRLVVATLPEMVFVSTGSIEMGNNFEGASPDERPIHTIFLDAFEIGKFEVTNGQYAAFLNAKENQIEEAVSWYNLNSVFAKIKSIDGQFIPIDRF